MNGDRLGPGDVHSPERRSFNMSRIRGRDTKPEMLIRRGLHARGFRFRLHDRKLAGCPDIVLPGRKSVVLIHGCFWHGHDCPMFRLPSTRREFWLAKIEGNRTRDATACAALTASGWRRLTIWECALRGPARLPLSDVLDLCEVFLRGRAAELHVQGRWREMKGEI